MNERPWVRFALSAVVAVCQFGIAAAASAQATGGLRVTSEQTVGGVAFPESVAYDPNAKALYVSEFVVEARPGAEGRQGADRQGVAGRQDPGAAVPAGGGRRAAQQAQGHLGQGRSAVGHRHRRRVGIRPENEARPEGRPARRDLRQRPGGRRQRALRERQPRRHAGPGGAGRFPQREERAQGHHRLLGRADQPERALSGARRHAADRRLPRA